MINSLSVQLLGTTSTYYIHEKYLGARNKKKYPFPLIILTMTSNDKQAVWLKYKKKKPFTQFKTADCFVQREFNFKVVL